MEFHVDHVPAGAQVIRKLGDGVDDGRRSVGVAPEGGAGSIRQRLLGEPPVGRRADLPAGGDVLHVGGHEAPVAAALRGAVP